MQNLLRNRLFVYFLYSLLPIIVSCSGLSKQSGSSRDAMPWPVTSLEEPILLRLKGKPGEEIKTAYYSASHIRNFEGTQLIRELEEAVDFGVLNRFTQVDPKTGKLTYIASTYRKDGLVDLNDLAFPELKEEIEFVLTPEGEVLKAGSYPEGSVFFIPPVPLPQNPVKVGDTWEVVHEWVGRKNGIPLQIRAVGIFKDALRCEGGICALIEISGSVEVLGANLAIAKFHSRLQGLMVFSVAKGEILWSKVFSTETLQLPEASSKVESCLSSVIVEPKDWVPDMPESFRKCEPRDI